MMMMVKKIKTKAVPRFSIIVLAFLEIGQAKKK
jgi:hypothetical protein